MKKLKFQFHLHIDFHHDIHHHYFTLKCYPKTEPRQVVSCLKTKINAENYSISQDSLHNKMIYGSKDEIHSDLDVYVEGKAEVDWTQYDTSQDFIQIYKLPTQYTLLKDELLSFFKECLVEIEPHLSPFDIACLLNKKVHQTMTYEKNTTTTHTTASQAFATKKGVCQDYVHIMLALLRGYHIPCRYVAGLMENENATHAWVEVYSKGKWYGFDPTNDLFVNDIYIVFSRGRDAKDTVINKGIFLGDGHDQSQITNIIVEEDYD